MPRQNREDYTCPCCGYHTTHKTNMHFHLYKLKKPCPKSKNVIELTDEIKQHILQNRIYQVPKQTSQQILIQQINNIQQINYFINKMNTFEKIDTLTKKTETPLIAFNEQIIQDFEQEISMCNKVETDLDRLTLRKSDIINIIDKLTTSDSIASINVVYDKTPNKLSIFDDGTWETYAFEHGVEQLIDKIKITYLDKYEEFLLDKMCISYPQEKQKAKELLEEYYNFIVSFDLLPFIVESQRDKIIDYNKQYYYIYDLVIKNIKLSHAKELKKNIYQMVKNNFSASMLELNKRMMDIICTDEEFKQNVLQRLYAIS